jgi:hypothetical protein
MKFNLTSRPADTLAKDALIVFVEHKKPLLDGCDELHELLTQLIKDNCFSGDAQQTAVFPSFGIHAANGGKTKPQRIILAGLGKNSAFRMKPSRAPPPPQSAPA